MNRNYISFIFIFFLSITANGQIHLNKLFYVEQLDTCFSTIITDYDINKQFQKLNSDKKYYKKYKLVHHKTDTLGADSLIIRFSDMRIGSSYPEYDVTTIEILRYYNDVRKANLAYNKILDNLLKVSFLDRLPITGLTDTSGFILSGPLDIIISTGFTFRFDNDPLHNISLTIDYQFDYQNNWDLKNEFIVILSYSKTKNECE